MDDQEMRLIAAQILCSITLAIQIYVVMLLQFVANRQDYLWEQHNKNNPKKEEKACPKPK